MARLVKPFTAARGGVGDLVVVLEEGNEPLRRKTERRRSAARPLPLVALSLKEKAPLGQGDELLRGAAIVGVIGFTTPGQGDHGGMMKVVVPESVEPVAIGLDVVQHPGLLPFVLRNQQ